MEVWAIGDIHGDWTRLWDLLRLLNPQDRGVIVQVGDLALCDAFIQAYEQRAPVLLRNVHTYVIEGNHEYFPFFRDRDKPWEMARGLTYMPRGSVLKIGRKRIGFLGGGFSIDHMYRTPNHKWYWPDDEEVTTRDIAKFDKVDHLDLLVTHTPPQSVIERNFDRRILNSFGYHPEWVDSSAVLVDFLWQRLRFPKLVCGHMHKAVRDGNCRILAEGEMVNLTI